MLQVKSFYPVYVVKGNFADQVDIDRRGLFYN